MSSSVFSMPDMAPSVSSSRATSFWAFSPSTIFGQQPLHQGERLQRLAEVMACRGEKARFRDSWPVRPAAWPPPARPPYASLGDVGEGDDDAFDAIVLGAVGQYAADVPGAAPRFDLALDRREGLQHRSRVGQKRAIGGQRIEVGERPADVAGNDVEQRPWWPA